MHIFYFLPLKGDNVLGTFGAAVFPRLFLVFDPDIVNGYVATLVLGRFYMWQILHVLYLFLELSLVIDLFRPLGNFILP